MSLTVCLAAFAILIDRILCISKSHISRYPRRACVTDRLSACICRIKGIVYGDIHIYFFS